MAQSSAPQPIAKKDICMTINENQGDETELARLGIKRVQTDIFHWGEYRYGNLRDAIAAAKREEKR
jgi:hypothetical protein